jgi:DNA-dependent metalloprotease WSS1
LDDLAWLFSHAKARLQSRMTDLDGLIGDYTHMRDMPDAEYALHMLKRIASCVKPIMRKRGWRVGTLSEFYPDQGNLLGAFPSGCRLG